MVTELQILPIVCVSYFFVLFYLIFLPMFVTDGNVKFQLEMRENKDQAGIRGSS